MKFTAGQVLDAATMNELASYPRILTFQIDQKGITNFVGTLTQDISRLEDPDGIGAINNTSSLTLPPGEYFLDIAFKVHDTGTYYAHIYDNTTGSLLTPEQYGYSSASDMNNILIKKKVTFIVPTTLSFRVRNVLTHNYTYDSMCSVTMLRTI